MATYFFEINVLSYVDFFHHLNKLFATQGLVIRSLNEYSPSKRGPLQRKVELFELDEALRKLEQSAHASLHARYFPNYEESYCAREATIPAIALSVYFRLIRRNIGVSKCVLSEPGELYCAPDWSVPSVLVGIDTSSIVNELTERWPTSILKKKEARLRPADCIRISESLMLERFGIVLPIESLCRIPGNSFPVLSLSDCWSVWFEKMSDQANPFTISINDSSGHAEFL